MTFLDVPTQPLLDIPADLQQTAWSDRSSSAPAWWNTYLNQVCLQTVLPWMQSEIDPSAQSFKSPSELQNLWQLVNGTALTFASHRVILIPDKTIDTQEFRVPQEWIDIPSWAGDYYFAAQVNPDDASVLIWGYTTHEQLKTQGSYDADDRTYCLEAQALIRDLTVFGVARELCPQEVTRTAVPPLPSLPTAQAEQLVQRLANPAVLLPRLEIPFQLWGAILEAPHWQQQLGSLRLGRVAPMASTIAHLSRWLQNTIDQGWQTLDALLDSPNLAYQFRQTAELGTAVQRIKVLQLLDQTLWLSVAIEPEGSDRFSIRVQLRSAESDATLPADTMLTLLSNSGEVVQSVTARDRDNGIQLRRFRCATGTQFRLQISVESISLTEAFTV
jgi:hypothetical protein